MMEETKHPVDNGDSYSTTPHHNSVSTDSTVIKMPTLGPEQTLPANNTHQTTPSFGGDSSASTACGTQDPPNGAPVRPSMSDPRGLPVAEFEEYPGLPRLNYRILDYKWKLSIIVFLLVLESALAPLILYYSLLYNTTLRMGIVFAIITSFFGIVSGIEFGLRCLKLILKEDKYRPPGGTKWSFDFTHWTLSFGYTVMTGILIGASIPHDPYVRILAIPLSLFWLQMFVQLSWSGWMSATHRPAPCKMSSIDKGERVPPLVLTLVEDIVGVDGAGGIIYRRALLARYNASRRFRKMIAKLNWFWAVGCLIDGVGTLVVIWTVPERVAYGVGWGSPLVFVIIWTIVSVQWVKHDLRREKKLWLEERGIPEMRHRK
ncbi:hypothetical protein QBC35DRAFT_97022 [Podospora australis]|uniref:Uncharacterized protein n=1 Tax=Podospora australis TaxID=1536484 RepID=A0AAN6WKM2_9PEZI|nr:hypothetical protein QBC35DRAFT_97022 [Podospora australis]